MMKSGYDIDECFRALRNYAVDCIEDWNTAPLFCDVATHFMYNKPFMAYMHDYAAFVQSYLDSLKKDL